MKQTAVDWFYQRILAKDIKKVFEQAKQMEKEQIEDAYDSGEANQYSEIYMDGYKDVSPNQYYNETYGKDA